MPVSRVRKPSPAAPTHYRGHPRYRGMTGHWMMNEGSGLLVRDHSGKGNHGVMEGMLSSDWVKGQFGDALSFDGTNNRVSFENTPLVAHSYGEFTLACWYRSHNLGTVGDDEGIFDHSDSGVVNQIQFRVDDAGEDEHFCCFMTNDGYITENAVCTTFSVMTRLWMHLAIVRSYSTGLVHQYVNGVEVGNTVEAYPDTGIVIAATGSGPHLGLADSGVEWGNQDLDDFRFYDRALLPAEIWSLYRDPFLEFRNEFVGAIPPYKPIAAVLGRWK